MSASSPWNANQEPALLLTPPPALPDLATRPCREVVERGGTPRAISTRPAPTRVFLFEFAAQAASRGLSPGSNASLRQFLPGAGEVQNARLFIILMKDLCVGVG